MGRFGGTFATGLDGCAVPTPASIPKQTCLRGLTPNGLREPVSSSWLRNRLLLTTDYVKTGRRQ
jgi:hypothetical protein